LQLRFDFAQRELTFQKSFNYFIKNQKEGQMTARINVLPFELCYIINDIFNLWQSISRYPTKRQLNI